MPEPQYQEIYMYTYICYITHLLYRECLHDHIMASSDAEVLCPYYDCELSVTEAEIWQVWFVVKFHRN